MMAVGGATEPPALFSRLLDMGCARGGRHPVVMGSFTVGALVGPSGAFLTAKRSETEFKITVLHFPELSELLFRFRMVS